MLFDRFVSIGWVLGAGFAAFAEREQPGQKEGWGKALLIPEGRGGDQVAFGCSAHASALVLVGIRSTMAGGWPRRVQARLMTWLATRDPPRQGPSHCAGRPPSAGRWIPVMATHRKKNAGRREACIAGLHAKPVKLSGPSGHLPAHLGLPCLFAGQEHGHGDGAQDVTRKPD